MSADEVAVVFLCGAPEQFEGHDEEDDADAGTGHHGFGFYLPGGGDEASVDGVPVP